MRATICVLALRVRCSIHSLCFSFSFLGWSWVKSDDIIEIVRAEMVKHGLEALYLATDSVEEQVIAKFRAAFPRFFTNKDSNILSALIICLESVSSYTE